MTFGPEPLWDAPWSLEGVLLVAVAGLVLAIASVWLFGLRGRMARTFARVLTVATVLWYAWAIEGVRRFGIQWVPGRWDIIVLRADILFILGWLALSAVTVVVVKRLREGGI
jgi:hypothetical protein